MRMWARTLLGLAFAVGMTGPGATAADLAAVQRLKGFVPASMDDAWKPTLYALLVGVTHDETRRYDLAYPAEDAISLAEALKAQKGRLYKDVVVTVLTDREATTIAVKRALAGLGKQVTARDLAVLFFAGRGATDHNGTSWFPTCDMDPGNMSATGLSGEDVSAALSVTPGKKLMFLDVNRANAASSGGSQDVGPVEMGQTVNDFAQARTGVITFAATSGRELSLENGQWGHGAFAKALIEGLGGEADLLHNGTITTTLLDLFLENRVKDLTDGRQHPVMTRPATVPDFPIATVQ